MNSKKLETAARRAAAADAIEQIVLARLGTGAEVLLSERRELGISRVQFLRAVFSLRQQRLVTVEAVENEVTARGVEAR
jgi:hypothetical protein